MRLIDRRSPLEKLRDDAPREVANAVRSGVANLPSSKAGKAGLIAAGGLAGLTAVSARISSRRHRGDR